MSSGYIHKPGKKGKSRRKVVHDNRRFSILVDLDDDDLSCYCCDAKEGLEIHEIFGGSLRERSKEYGLVVPLCWECHHGTYGAHGPKGKMLNTNLKENGQMAFEKRYPATDFVKVFGRNYL